MDERVLVQEEDVAGACVGRLVVCRPEADVLPVVQDDRAFSICWSMAARAVVRAVVDHDQLVARLGVLEQRPQRPAQDPPAVVRGDHDRDTRPPHRWKPHGSGPRANGRRCLAGVDPNLFPQLQMYSTSSIRFEPRLGR